MDSRGQQYTSASHNTSRRSPDRQAFISTDPYHFEDHTQISPAAAPQPLSQSPHQWQSHYHVPQSQIPRRDSFHRQYSQSVEQTPTYPLPPRSFSPQNQIYPSTRPVPQPGATIQEWETNQTYAVAATEFPQGQTAPVDTASQFYHYTPYESQSSQQAEGYHSYPLTHIPSTTPSSSTSSGSPQAEHERNYGQPISYSHRNYYTQSSEIPVREPFAGDSSQSQYVGHENSFATQNVGSEWRSSATPQSAFPAQPTGEQGPSSSSVSPAYEYRYNLSSHAEEPRSLYPSLPSRPSQSLPTTSYRPPSPGLDEIDSPVGHRSLSQDARRHSGDLVANSDQVGSSSTASNTPVTQKPKRRRADAAQLRVLHEVYARTAFPTTEERVELGKKLNMSPRQVQIWFQNRRQNAKAGRGQPHSSPTDFQSPETSPISQYPGAYGRMIKGESLEPEDPMYFVGPSSSR
ncbi:hypothetical protein FRB99_004233 [Tulasnella sp. 403]|nr:hypothetical protein FRB99_004233 [Tulasnella sp. 403]